MPRLDHVNIHTRDADAMVAFLGKVLGAEEGYRPPFSDPGRWLYLDGHPFIHLSIVTRGEDFPPGMFNHVAFGFYDHDAAVERITATGYRFEHDAIPDTDIGQIFVYGPEGLKIELQYRR
ncbi:VOC family protein [Neorhizobium galegae]|uniref:VOC family protein n=1 Tax=Neorhizobium galegae TaxID=399 RepID=UPI002106B6D8|nr:VOC family protein [Neorhizobium galegae]MCQ1849822.1 VOC family protein [Neorhizobium galegae]